MRLVSEIAIDLGTANVVVYRRVNVSVLEEPSVVAVNMLTKKV